MKNAVLSFYFWSLGVAVWPIMVMAQDSTVIVISAGKFDPNSNAETNPFLFEVTVFQGDAARLSFSNGAANADGPDVPIYARAYRKAAGVLAPVGQVFLLGKIERDEPTTILTWKTPDENVAPGEYVLRIFSRGDDEQGVPQGSILVRVVARRLPTFDLISDWTVLGKFETVSEWLVDSDRDFRQQLATQTEWEGVAFVKSNTPGFGKKWRLKSAQFLVVAEAGRKYPLIEIQGNNRGKIVRLPSGFFDHFSTSATAQLQLAELLASEFLQKENAKTPIVEPEQ